MHNILLVSRDQYFTVSVKYYAISDSEYKWLMVTYYVCADLIDICTMKTFLFEFGKFIFE